MSPSLPSRARVLAGVVASALIVGVAGVLPDPQPAGATEAANEAAAQTSADLDAIVHNLSGSLETPSQQVASAAEGTDTYFAWREGNRVAVGAVREHGTTQDLAGPILVDPEGPGVLTTDRPGIAAVGDDVYVSWSEAVLDPTETRYPRWVWEVFIAVSHDRGHTFAPAEQVSAVGGAFAYAPKLAVSDDVIGILWKDGHGLHLADRATTGGTWRTQAVGRAVNSEYEIAAAGTTVHVAFIDGTVQARRLTGPGATLTAPVAVSQPRTGATHPDLAVEGSDVAIGWIDYQGDSDELEFHPIWMATSRDDGATFGRTLLNTDKESCGICGGPGPEVGIAGGRFHAAFSSGAVGVHEVIVENGTIVSRTPVGTSPVPGQVADLLVTAHAVVVAYTRFDVAAQQLIVHDAARRHGTGTWVTRQVSRSGHGVEPVLSPLGDEGDYLTAWHEHLVGLGGPISEVLARPAAVADPDLAALSVQPVQAADGAQRLVAGKPTTFRARVRSGFGAPGTVVARWTIDDGDGSPHQADVQHVLRPGVQMISYRPPIELSAGTVSVSVTLDSAQALQESDEANNATSHAGLPVVNAEAHDILYIPLSDGPNTTPCRDVQLVAATSEPFLDAVWPADPDASRSVASCATTVVHDRGLWGGKRPFGPVHTDLVDQLEGALAEWDHIVIVAPDGWIESSIDEAKPNTQGIANVASGGGIAIIEARGLGGTVVAHELSHDLQWLRGPLDDGGDNPNHTTDHPAPGWWVERDLAVLQHDFMHPTTAPNTVAVQSWISTETWEYLLDLGTRQASASLDAAAEGAGLAVHGAVDADGIVTAGTWRSVDAPPTTDQADAGDPEAVEVVVVDDEGDALANRRLALSSPADADLTVPSSARAFSGVVPVPEGAAAVEVRVDGDVALRRERSATAPTIEVTGPGAGTAAPGGDVTVAWTATDTDGDALEADIEVSTDGGESWVPVRSGVDGSSVDVTVTPELRGDLTFRVTATDGWHTASATSETVTVQTGTTNGRVAFLRNADPMRGQSSIPDAELWTMAADGSDAHRILARQPLPGPNGQEHFTSIVSSSWSPDGARLAVDLGEGHDLAIVNADGTGLHPVGLLGQFPDSRLLCPTWSPDGERLAFIELGPGAIHPNAREWRVWTVRSDGTDAHLVVGQPGFTVAMVGRCPLDWAGPDGGRIFLSGRWGREQDGSSIFSFLPDGTDRRRVVKPVEDQTMDFSVSPDGQTLAFIDHPSQYQPQIWVMPVDGSQRPEPLTDMPVGPPETARPRSVAWAPDGSSLLAEVHVEYPDGTPPTEEDVRVERIDALTGARLPLGEVAGFDDAQPVWQPIPTVDDDHEPLPVVTATIAPVTGPVVEGASVTLDASGSTADEDITDVRWDLDGDGEFDDATGATPTTTFADDGDVTVAVEVVDGIGQSAFASATVAVADGPPVIASVTASADDGYLSVDATVENPGADGLEARVTWPGGATAVPATVSRGEGGRWSVSARIASTSTSGTVQLDVDDLDGGTDAAEAAFVAAPANQAPSITPIPATTTMQGVPVDITVTTTDPDGPAASVQLVVTTPPTNGTVSMRGGSSVVVYTPNAGYVGTDRFSVAAMDERGARSAPVQATVTVNGPPAPPSPPPPPPCTARPGLIERLLCHLIWLLTGRAPW